MLFLITLVFVFVSIYVWRFYENVKRYPKGPTPYPLVGNLLSMNMSRMGDYVDELSKEYGDVFTIWLPYPHVCITSYDAVKEAFITKGDAFLGRSPDFPENLLQSVPNGGVLNSEGDNWVEQRRTSIQILREFGMGKNLMEEQVIQSVNECLKFIDNAKNLEQFDPRWPIQLYVANVISKTLFGYKYEYDNCDRLMKFVDLLGIEFIENMRKNPLVLLAQSFPIIKSIPYIGYKAVGQYVEVVKKLRVNILEDIEKTLKEYDPTQEPESFVQAYVREMEKNPMLNKEQLVDVSLDFFLAGMETTSTTLRWSMLFLAENQRVQDKIREEIFAKIGDRFPCMSDKPKMPYTSAAIQELQRKSNLLPMNLIHRSSAETTVAGVKIPNNTRVFGQIYSIMKSSKLFEEPEKLKPERFLLEDGVTPNKKALEKLVPFSMGKRQCAGEGLARVELFIGLVSILQKFKIEPLPNVPVNTTPIYGGVLLPRQQKLKFSRVNV